MAEIRLEARVSVDGGARVESRTASGHEVVADVLPPTGGDSAARPTELVLAALASCTAVDVVSILAKKRQAPARYDVAITAQKADETPSVFVHIVVEHQVEGDIEPEAVRRAVELSAMKYCPVSRMLSKALEIEHRYRVTRRGGEVISALVAVTGPDGDRVV